MSTRSTLVTEADVQTFLNSLNVTDEEIEYVKNVEQREPEWHAARANRISASLFGAAAGHNKYCSREQLVKEKLWKKFETNNAMRHGTFHEDDAEITYRAYMKEWLGDREFRVEHTGLIIVKDTPFVGVSPDGIAHTKLEDGSDFQWLIEIKCPFSRGDPKLYPKIPWYYYDQIQGIMGFLNLPFADFIVWTPATTQITRFKYNKPYFEQTLRPAIMDFYLNMYVPSAILKERGVLEENEIRPVVDLDITPFLSEEQKKTVPPAKQQEEAKAKVASLSSSEFSFF